MFDLKNFWDALQTFKTFWDLCGCLGRVSVATTVNKRDMLDLIIKQHKHVIKCVVSEQLYHKSLIVCQYLKKKSRLR